MDSVERSGIVKDEKTGLAVTYSFVLNFIEFGTIGKS